MRSTGLARRSVTVLSCDLEDPRHVGRVQEVRESLLETSVLSIVDGRREAREVRDVPLGRLPRERVGDAERIRYLTREGHAAAGCSSGSAGFSMRSSTRCS